MSDDFNPFDQGFDHGPTFLFDDELGEPDTTSDEYLEGVKDATEGNGYNQYYLPTFNDNGSVRSVPKGGFNYDQGFKSAARN